MITIMLEEVEFLGYMQQWAKSGRNLVTLPTISEDKLELSLSIVCISNTKQLILKKKFYTYESILGYYGKLIDQLNDA